MRAAVLAAAAYFAIAFAAGFVLGAVRVLALAPSIGELAATACELPLMLAVSWFAASFTARRLGVSDAAPDRLIMGGLAFFLLIGAEVVLASVAFDRTISMQVAAWKQPAGALGLLGQVAFAAIPFVQARLKGPFTRR